MSSSPQVRLPVFLFHAGSLALYAGNLVYENKYILTPGATTKGGRWKYLTYWNEIMQFLYFTWATLVDVITLVSKPKKRNVTHGSRDFFFSTITFPLAMVVSVIFWAIYAIDREMIYPTFLDQIIPSFVNHVLHTFCFFLMIFESIISHHHYPIKRTGIATLLIMSALYLSWMGWQAYAMDGWPYPFLNNFTMVQHCVFYLGYIGVLCISYIFGEFITTFRFSNEPKKLKKGI